MSRARRKVDEEERRSAHRTRMAEFRSGRSAEGICSRCPLPTEINRYTGKPKRLCPTHLYEDKRRSARRAAKIRKARAG